jgi:hypothetical protein
MEISSEHVRYFCRQSYYMYMDPDTWMADLNELGEEIEGVLAYYYHRRVRFLPYWNKIIIHFPKGSKHRRAHDHPVVVAALCAHLGRPLPAFTPSAISRRDRAIAERRSMRASLARDMGSVIRRALKELPSDICQLIREHIYHLRMGGQSARQRHNQLLCCIEVKELFNHAGADKSPWFPDDYEDMVDFDQAADWVERYRNGTYDLQAEHRLQLVERRVGFLPLS